MKQLYRRDFLKLSSAFAAGAIVRPAEFLRATTPEPLERAELERRVTAKYEVLIIGGGLSGLMAARTLVKLGVTDLKVLEARDRVGGRTLNQPMGGGYVAESGGQWWGRTQTAIEKLMGELGIQGFDSYTQGRTIDDTTGSIGPFALFDYQRARRRLNRMSKEVPLDAPWSAPQAATWDQMNVRQWMDANMSSQGGKDLIELEVLSTLSADPADVSLLYFLFYVHSGTDLQHLETFAQEKRIVGGSQSISLAMAAQLGNKVALSAPVAGIHYAPHGVMVQVGQEVLAARKLIVAMMPAEVARIPFVPGLPAKRVALQNNWSGGPGAKFSVSYPTPWWRAQGLSGQAISDTQFLGITFDNSPPDASSGILMGFPNDENSIPTTLKERQRGTIRSLVHFFGPRARTDAIDYQEYDWGQDPLVTGCVSPLKPGILTQFGPALRKPVGPIHWAGTETSEIWTGYMDGAIRAGDRAAREVEALLP